MFLTKTTSASFNRRVFSWLLILATFSLTIVFNTTVTAQNPQSGDVNLSGTVTGAAPTEPAVITQPLEGQRFSTNQLSVKGTCPSDGAFVQIFRNNTFAGTASCIAGEFSLGITALPGANTLFARVFSSGNAPGPDSASVTVFFDPPAGSSPGATGDAVAPVLVVTAPLYPGGYVQRQLTIELEVLGGEGPYAVSIDWGDGTSDLLVRQANGKFNMSHIYSEAGTFEVKISVSDVNGRKATVQTVAIISGEPVKVDLETFIEQRTKSVWVRILGPILLIFITYIAGLMTGLKIVGDELRDQHLHK